MPFDSKIRSDAASPEPSSIINPYWNPEQPPPCTNTRNPAAFFCLLRQQGLYPAGRRVGHGHRPARNHSSRFSHFAIPPDEMQV